MLAGRGCTGCSGSRSGRAALGTAVSRWRSGCRRRTCCTAAGSRAAACCGPLLLVPFVLPTVVVGVAFRQLLAEGGPLGFLGLDGTPAAIIAGLVFFNAAVVIRIVGGAWESLDPRPAEAAAALGATPFQVLRTVTLPALRPAIVSARPASCSSSAPRRSASCSPSAGCGTARSRPRSTCSPPTCSTSRRRPRCRCCSWSSWSGCCSRPHARGVRRTPSLARVVAAAAAAHPRATCPPLRRHRRRSRCSSSRRSRPCVVGSLRSDGSWTLPTTARCTTTGDEQALLVPVTDALMTSLRTAVDATWMSLLLGLTVAVVATRRSRSPRRTARADACSTASSCCRSGSRR